MALIIEKLSDKHQSLIDAFSCVETPEMLSCFNAKERRRIINHSKDMDYFIKNNALIEQNKNLNTTHLLIDSLNNELIGYLSLCADSLKLLQEEKTELNVLYTNIPALKIARLAVSNKHRGNKMGKLLIQLSVYFAKITLQYLGISFLTLDCYQHRLSYYEQFGFKKNMFQASQIAFDAPISMRISLTEILEKVNRELEE